MVPPDHPPPRPPEAAYPPSIQLVSLLMQALQQQQQQRQQQAQQQQERERELHAERRVGQLEAISAFQAILTDQQQHQGTGAGPNVRAALQELTRIVTASYSTSGGQQALASFPERQQFPRSPATNNSAIAGEGVSNSNTSTGTLLEQLLLALLRQQQEQQRQQACASYSLTNPPVATDARSMTGYSMDHATNAWTSTNNNNSQKSNNHHAAELERASSLLAQREPTAETSETSTTTRASKTKTNKKTPRPPQRGHENFPEKLYRILTELEATGQDDIISFSAQGDAFEIHQPEVFEDEIIPLYFHHCKLGSVKRQLGLYGFKRVSKGRIEMEYQHELFRKGQPSLLSRIKRACKNKNSTKSSNSKAAATAANAPAGNETTSMIHDEEE